MRGLVCFIYLVVVLAACNDGGVVVLVDPSPGVTSVRLYVSRGMGQHANYLEASPVAATTDANRRVDQVTYWARDPGNSSDFVTVTSTKDPVGFTLVRGDEAFVDLVIAVGYDANDTPIATGFLPHLELPGDNQFAAYHLTLHAPVSLLDNASNWQLGLWSPALETTAREASCAGLVIDLGGQPLKGYITTDNDQDCDGLTNDDPLECDHDAWMSMRPANRDELSCLVQDAAANCYLGGPTCVDNTPRDMTTCEPSRYCAADDLCTTCLASGIDCASDVTKLTPTTHYLCSLSTDTSGNICQTDLVFDRPPTGGFDCSGVAIRDTTSNFGDRLDVGNFRVDVQLTAGCQLVGKPSGQPPNGMTTPMIGAMVAFDLDNGNGLGVPVVFRIETTPSACNSDVQCVLMPQVTAFAPDLTHCMAGWGPPTLVAIPGFNGNDMTDPTLDDNMTEMYFASGGVIYHTTDTPTGWSPAMPVPELNIHGMETSPDMTSDGKTMYLASHTAGLANHVYISTWVDPGQWSTPMPLMAPTAAGAESGAATDDAQDTLMVASNLTATDFNIVDLSRSSAGMPWILGPVNAANTPNVDDITPYLSPDGLHLYFASVPPSGFGYSIYVASRSSTLVPFTNRVWLKELSADGKNDVAPWVSRDGHTMYFASDRGTAQPSQIYMSRRP